MLHVSRKMITWKAKSMFNEKNDDPAMDGVKSLCEDTGSLSEEKLQLVKRIHPI